MALLVAFNVPFNVLVPPIASGPDVETRDPVCDTLPSYEYGSKAHSFQSIVETLVDINGYDLPLEEKRSPSMVDPLITIGGYDLPPKE
ncbi:hypothetical protein F5Y14DRAFT_446752 [Nemania sp. NC0429]|nr:hypothetical protein F5Y14DRAFT_446752 [Nemania sp. NC0429]